MTDLEFELAMMAVNSAPWDIPLGFEDKPDIWKDELASAYQKHHRWFASAITEYLKGR